jgi:alpha-L-arabinofuranosidase
MFSANRGDEVLPVQVTSPLAEVEKSRGQVGVGTWNTAAEFKDMKVTAPDRTVLFQSDLSNGSSDWQKLGDGAWNVKDGALQQAAEKEFVRALAGQRDWTNYTFTLKARKISGREGFLILFHIASDEGRNWWNIGGWENSQDGIEFGDTLDRKDSHIETGRWYDIKLVVIGSHAKCYLDGQLIHDVDFEKSASIRSLYACASHDDATGDVIVKVVNASASPLDATVDLSGAKNLTGKGSATVLTSASGADENSLAEPTKVSPKTEPVDFSGSSLTRSFPGNSFTVLRLQTK